MATNNSTNTPTGTGVVQSSGTTYSVSTALASGTTATTQSAGTNSTAVATTAYADSTTAVSVANASGYQNKFYNPNMDIWQRGTSGSITTGVTSYTADGWTVTPTGATVSWSQNNQLANTQEVWVLKLTGNASMTQTVIRQRIESYVATQLLNITGSLSAVTFQCRVFQDTGSAVVPTITVSYANAKDDFSGVTTDLSAVNLQSVSSGGWAVLAYTWTPSSANYANGIQVSISLGSALDTNAKNFYCGNFDLRKTTSVTTGLNASPPVPEKRQISQELNICQRYFETSYPNSTAPGTSGVGNVQKYPLGLASGGFFTNTFKVQKRTAPTISYWDGAGNASKTSTYIAAGTATDNVNAAVAPTNITVNGFDWGATGGVSVVGTGLAWSATAEL